jgi:hypothetical protein
MLREQRDVVNYEVTVDEKKNKVLVSVKMVPKMAREKTVRIGVQDVREYLETQGVEAGVLISGQGIHNNMDRRLGLRTADNLRSNWIFSIADEVPVEEVVPVVVTAPVEVIVEATPPEPISELVSPAKEIAAKKTSTRSRNRSKKSVDK